MGHGPQNRGNNTLRCSDRGAALARGTCPANSAKRRKKMGSSVAYKTIGTFLSQNMGHEDACGWATEMQSSGCAAVRQGPSLRYDHWTCTTMHKKGLAWTTAGIPLQTCKPTGPAPIAVPRPSKAQGGHSACVGFPGGPIPTTTRSRGARTPTAHKAPVPWLRPPPQPTHSAAKADAPPPLPSPGVC